MATNFPSSLDTATTLYTAVNNVSTNLNGAINNAVTTITVLDTSLFPSSGIVTIDAEAIAYTGKSLTQFTGCTRGFDGTTAVSHTDTTQVNHNVVAAHHNILKDAIIAVETDLNARLGIGASSNAIAVPSGVSFSVASAITGTKSSGSSLVINTSDLVVDSTNHRLGVGTASPARRMEVGNNAGTADEVLRVNAPTGHYSIAEFTENDSTTAGQYWQMYKVPSTDGTAPHGLSFWNNGDKFTLSAAGVAGFVGDVTLNKSSTADTKIKVYNPNTGSAANAILMMETSNGGAGGGDPYLLFRNSSTNYAMGCDVSDSAKFKLSYFDGLGTNDRIAVDSVGLMTLTNSNTNGGALTLNNTGTRGPGMSFQKSGTAYGYVGVTGWWLGSAATDFMIAAESGSKIRHFYNGGINSALDIETTGAMTTRAIAPFVDNSYALGTSSLRYSDVWGALIHAGDLVFDNDWAITEGDKVGRPKEELLLKAPNGKLYKFVTQEVI